MVGGECRWIFSFVSVVKKENVLLCKSILSGTIWMELNVMYQRISFRILLAKSKFCDSRIYMINKGRNPSKVDGSSAIAMMVLLHTWFGEYFSM